MPAKVAWLLHVGTNAASAKAFAHVDSLERCCMNITYCSPDSFLGAK